MGKKYIQPVRGTHDLIGDEMRLFRHIVDAARDVAWRFGFDEIQTPIFEFSDVFHRSLGDTSDVVSKETYTFEDRGGENITLRPEFTAAIVRAFISNGYTQKLPFKAFYSGPAFRYERPQKGRQRQFHQIGVECLGAKEPWQDVEAILCADQLLTQLFGDKKDKLITLEINTLGDKQSRDAYREALIAYFSQHEDKLSEESQIRLGKNPLRILDSKQEEDQVIVANAPLFEDSLSPESLLWFEAVTGQLKALGVPFDISPRLVRGLDYYTHTVFEFTTTKLGAQATVLAGGRYNDLVAQMGGGNIAGMGWAAGIERLMILLENAAASGASVPSIAILPRENPSESVDALKLLSVLGQAGYRADIIYHQNLGKAFKKADAAHSDYAVILDGDSIKVKSLASGQEEVVAETTLVNYFNSLSH